MKEDLNTQIEKFPVWNYINKKLIPAIWIKSKDDYNHFTHELHHFVREQQYYRNPKKYENIQKLILLPKFIYDKENEKYRSIHADCHSYNKNFETYYGIKLDDIIYRGK